MYTLWRMGNHSYSGRVIISPFRGKINFHCFLHGTFTSGHLYSSSMVRWKYQIGGLGTVRVNFNTILHTPKGVRVNAEMTRSYYNY